jgi:hypothetical protein
MKLPPFVAAVGREALVVLGGALIAALVLRQLPGVKAYIKDSWN